MKNETTYRRLRQDERLKHLDSERIEFLTQLAEELSDAPQKEKTIVFLNIMQKARKKNIAFSPPEQELLFSVLTENMNPEEKKKAMMIRNLSLQFMQQRKNGNS